MAIERAYELLEGMGQLPVLPAQADEMLSLAMSGDTDTERLLAAIERDPVLVAMVLRLVNSAAFSLSREISNVRHASTLLGLHHVRSLALAASLAALMTPDPSTVSLWHHAFWVACGARALALELEPAMAETAFALGMLHDIGDLVLVTMPVGQEALAIAEGPDASLRLDMESATLGTDHPEIGAALASRWSIPDRLIEGIRNHHEPPTGRGTLGGLVAATEAVCFGLLGLQEEDGVGSPLDMLSLLGARNPEATAQRVQEAALLRLTAEAPSTGRRLASG